MNKKELFDALDGFSQNLLVTLAEVEAIKKNLKQVIEENTAPFPSRCAWLSTFQFHPSKALYRCRQ